MKTLSTFLLVTVLLTTCAAPPRQNPAATTALSVDPAAGSATQPSVQPEAGAGGTSNAAHTSDVDHTHVALGDGKLSSTAQRDYLWSCMAHNNVSSKTGFPWLNGDGTWDMTKKLTVDGSVTWTSKHPYRVLLEGGKQFHVFFYDAPVARAIAFQGLLNSGDNLIHRLMNDFGHGDGPQLVSTATDGESFGHHHHFGEMAIAYAMTKMDKQKTAHLTNYAEFLEKFGSQWEVDIYEKSSWSCAHGVERWRSDCGCRMNHAAGWNQKWRTVLREAFDVLQESVDRVFETQAGRLLKDPWQARNDYIRVMLDPSEKQKKSFLSRQMKKALSVADEKKIWDLLEAEKFSLLMYTSCGWFFDDIAGIEPVQVMKFALRAMELVQPYHDKNLEAEFVKMMARAKSNIPENGTGADVFEKMVKSARPMGDGKIPARIYGV